MATPAEAVLSRWWWAKWWLKRNYKRLIAVSIIVVIIVWMLWPKPPPESWPKVKGPIITIDSRRNYLAVPLGQESGVERIYLVPTGHYDPYKDISKQDYLVAIKSSNQSPVAIPPESIVDIVVVVRAFAPEFVAYASKENIAIAIKCSGSFSIPFEYSTDDQEFIFENENYGKTPGYLRMNVVWDNYGEGYLLPAYGYLHIENLNWQRFVGG